MLFFSMLVAGSFSLGVQIANDISALSINSFRFLVSSIIIGSAAVALHGSPRPHFRGFWRYIILGGMFASYFVLMFIGLKTAAPVSAAAVFTLTPIVAAVAGYLMLRQVTTGHMAIALAIGAVGALWVIFRADWQAFLAFDIGRGEVIYFVGCVAHAVYAPTIRLLNRGEPVLMFTFGMLIGGTALLVIYGWSDILATDWMSLPTKTWLILAYLSIGASTMTFVLFQFASLRLKSAKVMAYTYLTPSWVLIWETVLGNGLPPLLILVGIALTIVALLILFKTPD